MLLSIVHLPFSSDCFNAIGTAGDTVTGVIELANEVSVCEVMVVVPPWIPVINPPRVVMSCPLVVIEAVTISFRGL
jgi:hypothetical protein